MHSEEESSLETELPDGLYPGQPGTSPDTHCHQCLIGCLLGYLVSGLGPPHTTQLIRDHPGEVNWCII